jgi:hypothetical protein
MVRGQFKNAHSTPVETTPDKEEEIKGSGVMERQSEI